MAEADDVSMETEQLEPIPTNEAGVPGMGKLFKYYE